MVAVGNPVILGEAMESSDPEPWRPSITKELKSIEDRTTWTKVAMPAGKTAISFKILFNRKLYKLRTVAHHKARLVAKGFFQKESIEYEKIFRPVVPSKLLLLYVGECMFESLHVHHADISTTFLNRNIYCEFLASWDNVVRKLKKNL